MQKSLAILGLFLCGAASAQSGAKPPELLGKLEADLKNAGFEKHSTCARADSGDSPELNIWVHRKLDPAIRSNGVIVFRNGSQGDEDLPASDSSVYVARTRAAGVLDSGASHTHRTAQLEMIVNDEVGKFDEEGALQSFPATLKLYPSRSAKMTLRRFIREKSGYSLNPGRTLQIQWSCVAER